MRPASRKARDGDKATPSIAAKDFLNSLIDYVPRLPETTRLVFVEFQPLNPKHQLIKLAEQQKGKTVIECRQPPAAELPRWIGDRKARWSRLPDVLIAATLALIVSQPIGPKLQEYITTCADMGDLEIVTVRRLGAKSHYVETRSS